MGSPKLTKEKSCKNNTNKTIFKLTTHKLDLLRSTTSIQVAGGGTPQSHSFDCWGTLVGIESSFAVPSAMMSDIFMTDVAQEVNVNAPTTNSDRIPIYGTH